MSFDQISDIVERAVEEHADNGMACTQSQLQACIAALFRLQDLTHDPVLTVTLFEELVAQSLTKEEAWDWVAAELRFEAHVVALGNRTEAALSCLRYRDHLSDQLLDTYNERIRRFDYFTTPTR